MKSLLHTTLAAVILIVGTGAATHADEAPLKVKEKANKQFSDLGLVELTLKNGMRVLLKQTDFEEDEVSFKISAPGGFAVLPDIERASAELGPSVAWESGVGGFSSDKIAAMFWEKSVEVDIRINPYSRVIEATASPEGVETLLKILHLYFTHSNFSKKGFDTVVDRMTHSIKRRGCDHETAFEDIYKSLNTENFSALRPLSLTDLEQADYGKSKLFFERFFSNPSEFVAVIVGNFDKETIENLINNHLATIPQSNFFWGKERSFEPIFPEGIISRNIVAPMRKDCLTRMTFPISVEMDEEKVFALDLAIQVIETRLRNVILEKMKTTHAVDVAYEFPMYPKLAKPWLSVQFTCEPEKKGPLRKLVIAELTRLQKEGPTSKEIEAVRSLITKSDDYWLKDNDYWVAVLSNYYSWGWDPTGIVKNYDCEPYLHVDNMKKIIQNYFLVTNYTVLSAKPQ